MIDDDNIDVHRKSKICEVCGEEVSSTIPCRMCGINFCDECGYTEKNLCYDCGDEFDEGLEDEADETLVESTEMDEEDLEEEED